MLAGLIRLRGDAAAGDLSVRLRQGYWCEYKLMVNPFEKIVYRFKKPNRLRMILLSFISTWPKTTRSESIDIFYNSYAAVK